MYSYLYTHILGIFFMADSISMDQLRQFFVDIFATKGNSAPADASAGVKAAGDAAMDAGKVLGPFAKGASDFLKLMTDNLPQVATGLLGVKDASNAAKDSLKTLASYVPLLGSALGKTIDVVDQYRTIGIEANKIGVGQLNALRLQEEAQKAGFKNADDYVQFLTKTAGNSLKNIGQSNELSSRKFLEFAERVQGQDLTKKLKGLGGMEPGEIARIAAIAAGGKTDQLKTDKGREELAISTAKAANEINRLSQATGKSREQIMSELEDSRKSARGQIELQALRNDAERDQYLKTQISINGMGKTMQDVTSTIMAGGYLDKTKRTELQVATGGRAGQYIQAVRNQRRTAGLADDDPQKIAAQKKLDAEISRANQYQSSRQFAQRALTTQNPDQKAAYEKLQTENAEKAGQAANQRETGLGPEQARRRLKVGYGDALIRGENQEALDQPSGAQGKENVGARTTQLLNQGYEAARVNAAAATGELRKFNEALGKSPEGLKPIREFFEFMFGPLGQTAKQASERQAGNTEAFKRAALPAETEKSKVELEKELEAAGLRKAKPVRAHGTLGEIGQATEPKDITAKIHKGETVVTPEQMKNLLSGSASNAISDVMKSATNSMPKSDVMKSATSNIPKTGGLDISKITSGLKEITTTISSVTGGASTTRFSNGNTTSKPVTESESDLRPRIMDDIKKNMSQYTSQAKARDMALKAMEEANATSYKINNSTGSGINRTKINDATSESVESISDRLSTAKNNKLTTEPEEIESPIEESNFEEKSNKVGLKDLNEQLVQLNTSIRQLIEHSAESVETAGKQVRATKSLSGNRFA